MSVTLKCEAPGCEAIKEADSLETCIALMQLHQTNVHESGGARQRPPKMPRPELAQDITEEDWHVFTKRWELFCRGTSLAPQQISAQLLACCEPTLHTALLREDPGIADKPEADILSSMKRLSVLKVALCARRAALLCTRQDPGEPVRQYVARLRGRANVCQWQASGPCSEPECEGATVVDYTDELVKLVLLNGLAEEEIRKEILGTPDIDTASLSETVRLVESKETAARAMADEGSRVAASTYKKERSRRPAPPQQPAEDDGRSQTFKCPCGLVTPRFGKVRGRVIEFQTCKSCWQKRRSRQPPQSARGSSSAGRTSEVHATREDTEEPTSSMFQWVEAIESAPGGAPPSVSIVKQGKEATLSIPDHYIFDGTYGWIAHEAWPHPTVPLTATIDGDAYTKLHLPSPPKRTTRISAVADSGAQTCLMGIKVLQKLGLGREHLTRVSKRVLAANNEEINILGAVFLRLSGQAAQGQALTTSAMVYVTDTSSRFYLSRQVLVQLGIVAADFPQVGSAVAGTATTANTDRPPAPDHRQAPCGCPLRTAPPARPAQLPFAPTPENTDRMRAWLLDRFASSTFNTCPHQPLPAMSGPPMEIRVDPTAKPVVTRRPPHVPVHWQAAVADQLKRDEALGVIERVPANTPVTWLHNMVITPKADGTPRRTVDFQPLNRHSVRETHHTVPPAKQARAIPPNTFKTVTDAWNGYHSIEILASDRHKTTFLTEQGRYRYRRVPMGFLASQDAYSERYDRIIADVPRKSKVVDDTVLWDDDIRTHWSRVLDYLELTGRNGMVLNPTKFQFCSKDVDFAGFHITASGVKPLRKYLDAIAAFPRPKTITDVRAWFGLVNQVSCYSKTTAMMIPFKHLLSPKVPFRWTPELEDAFRLSKEAIVREIEEGVEIFDPRRRTCLSPDWSQTGVGYWLRQKHCRCQSLTPGCCPGGWRVTLAGSRFLRAAEERYAPVEGEALAVAWALEDSRFFTMGCTDLVVASDHKPLVKLLGDKALDDIQNPRLFRIKQRTLMWRFRIVHVPGRDTPAADAASRYPSTQPPSQGGSHMDVLAAARAQDDTGADMEPSIVAAAQRSAADALQAVTWERVRGSTNRDGDLQLLKTLIRSGFPMSRDDLPKALQPFWQYRDRLSTVDEVIMMDDRILVPRALRAETLRALHAAHQGTVRMASRAQSAIFWPGIAKDIEEERRRCPDCRRMAPSQAHLPPTAPCIPTRPFQAIAADFFTMQGVGYLVVVDRFSGWPHLVASLSGAKGFIKAIINYFSTFGVPQEISTDGGPEFVARETTALFQRWGVHHRLSSAYHPQSNGRAEVAVKSMKRLLTAHTDGHGGIDTEAAAAGLLQYRNTPDPETGLSPAQIVFGHNLRDLLPITPGSSVFDNEAVHPVWRETWKHQEKALRLRFARQIDNMDQHTRHLPSLPTGATVVIQNQSGPHSKRWDRTGIVVQAKPHDQYLVRVHGSGRVTLRNRRFLRQITSLAPPERRPLTSPSIPVPLRSSPSDAGPAADRPFPGARTPPVGPPALDAEHPGSPVHDTSPAPGPVVGSRDSPSLQEPSPTVASPAVERPATSPLPQTLPPTIHSPGAEQTARARPASTSDTLPVPRQPPSDHPEPALPATSPPDSGQHLSDHGRTTPHRRSSSPSAASPDAPPPPRRSQRTRQRPAHLRDYVTPIE